MTNVTEQLLPSVCIYLILGPYRAFRTRVDKELYKWGLEDCAKTATRIQRWFRQRRAFSNDELDAYVPDFDKIPESAYGRRLMIRMYAVHYPPKYYNRWPLMAMGASIYDGPPRWTWGPEVLAAWMELVPRVMKSSNQWATPRQVRRFMEIFEVDWIMQIGW